MNYIIVDFEMNPVAESTKRKDSFAVVRLLKLEQLSWMKASWCWENSRL